MLQLLRHIGYFFWLPFCVLALCTQCNRHNTLEEKLTFSSDTVYFDTVFTTVSTVTRNFRVINPTDEPMTVDIRLAGGSQSYYNINVDGQAGYEFHNVEIPARDSLFIFVRALINPTDQNTPYLVTDSILFSNDHILQQVQLVAFGQDAHFILPDHTSGSMRYRIVAHEHEVTHWTNDKPWVIYDWAVVDSLGQLIIDPGTRIYVHKAGGLWIYRDGNLQVNGTAEEPVVFAGDRREPFYASDYAQWSRIWINESSHQDNVLNHVVITNAAIGLQCSSIMDYNTSHHNKTIVNNSIIHNNADVGVLVRAANLEMNNCQVSSNQNYSVVMQVGDFNLNHVTVANYSGHQNPSMVVGNFFDVVTLNANGEYETVYMIGDANLNCRNSIVYGNRSDGEFATSTIQGAAVNYSFQNCIVRKNEFDSHFVQCLNKDPKFVNNYEQDYNLKEDSPAIDAGMTGLGITTDLLGRLRNGVPDIGAFEYYPATDMKSRLSIR